MSATRANHRRTTRKSMLVSVAKVSLDTVHSRGVVQTWQEFGECCTRVTDVEDRDDAGRVDTDDTRRRRSLQRVFFLSGVQAFHQRRSLQKLRGEGGTNSDRGKKGREQRVMEVKHTHTGRGTLFRKVRVTSKAVADRTQHAHFTSILHTCTYLLLCQDCEFT